jgi:hypothetical protein
MPVKKTKLFICFETLKVRSFLHCFFICFQVENKVTSMDKIFCLHPHRKRAWDIQF